MEFVTAEELREEFGDFSLDGLLCVYETKNLLNQPQYQLLVNNLYKVLDTLTWDERNELENTMAELSLYKSKFFFNLGRRYPEVMAALLDVRN